MEVPTDKYLLQDYRDDMRTSDAPQMIDTQTPLIPVKNIGSGLPKPNSKQRLLKYHVYKTNAASAYVNVATPSSNTRIYFLGVIVSVYDTLGRTVSAYDGSSGTAQHSVDANTINFFTFNTTASAYGNFSYFAPFPVQVVSGIRLFQDTLTASGSLSATFYYIEEIV